MALLFTEQFRGTTGGRAIRGFQVTADGTNATINASDLDLIQIESVVLGDKANLTGTKSFPSTSALVDGVQTSTDITVTGAALGDIVCASINTNTSGCILAAEVSATNTVHVILQNETGAAVTPGVSTVLVEVEKHIGFSTQSGTSIVFYPVLANGDTFNIVVTGY